MHAADNVDTGASPDTIIHAWSIDKYDQEVNKPIDTLLNNFHIYNPLFTRGKHHAYLGNLGSPAWNNIYTHTRSNPFPFIFIKSYAPYVNHYSQATYYNTRAPFSLLTYISSMSAKEELEQTLRIMHTQNVNRKLNAGLSYDIISSEGQYLYQKSTIGSFSVFSSYSGDIYSMKTNINLNSINTQQNGGLDEYNYYVPENQNVKTKQMSTNLRSANTKIKDRNMFFSQQVNFVKKKIADVVYDTVLSEAYLSGDTTMADSVEIKKRNIYNYKAVAYLSHTITYDNTYMLYTDNAPLNYYYPLVFDTLQTLDSAKTRKFSNTFMFTVKELTLEKFKIGCELGLTNELLAYGNIMHSLDTMIDSTIHRKKLFNEYVRIDLFNRSRTKLNYYIGTAYCVHGYNSGNYGFEGMIRRNYVPVNAFLQFSASLEKERPDYFYNYFSSNHLRWDTVLNDQQIQRMELTYNSLPKNFGISLTYTDIDKFLYLDQMMMPRQKHNRLSVFSVDVFKKVQAWKLVSESNIHYQRISRSSLLSLPELCVFTSAYIDHTVHFSSTGGRIQFQLGTDIIYTSSYYVYAYSPYANHFYLHNTYQYGNYPYIDPFIKMKIKRMRIFLKYEHINQTSSNKKYISVWHYPMNEKVLKMGLSMTFYN